MTLVASPYFDGGKRIGVVDGEYGDGSPCFEVVHLWADTESYRDAISTLTPRRHFGSFARAKQWIDETYQPLTVGLNQNTERPMTPEEAIGRLNDLRNHLHTRLQHFAGECDGIQEQWTALGLAGGQRADHAAALLGKLKNHLQGISGYCDGVVEQIDAMIADPFGRDG